MRILYLATADARGHLMRAQLLTHALRANGHTVHVITTSDEGIRFLAGFDIEASLLSRHYAVQFDRHQNMLRKETDANVAAYLFRPTRMLRDILHLRPLLRKADLMINDSFHPAALCMGCMPFWRRKVVHVYGASLRHALETNFHGRLPGWVSGFFRRIVALQINRSHARLEHDFSFTDAVLDTNNTYRLPTPVAIARPTADTQQSGARRAAVYLNPHFRDTQLAESLELGLKTSGVQGYLVGEGYAGRTGWVAHSPDWADRAAASDVIISAPGMAALSIALVYERPIILIVTDQPEQQINAARASELGVKHRTVVWQEDRETFSNAMDKACRELLDGVAAAESVPAGRATAEARLATWVSIFTAINPAS